MALKSLSAVHTGLIKGSVCRLSIRRQALHRSAQQLPAAVLPCLAGRGAGQDKPHLGQPWRHGQSWHTPASVAKVDTAEVLETVDLPPAVVDEPSGGAKVLCEFIVQALFNFLSVSAVAIAIQNSGGNAMLKTLQVMAAHGAIIPLLIYAAGPISGAHFNPAVSVSMMFAGQLSFRMTVGYVIAQTLGGVVGAAAAFSCLPSALQTLAYSGIQAVPAASTVSQAFLGEVCASFVFLFVLFGTLVDKRSGLGKAAPLVVPVVIALLMWLVGPVSSLCINPARAFGPAVITGFWEEHWIWWTAPFVGGISASVLYSRFFMPLSQKLKR